MNWDVAHRIAGIAANQAHRDLGVDRSEYVPVHAALRSAGLIGMAQPMPRLFGVYFDERTDGPAVLLNAALDVITQRHTAAHELGHHRLHHRSTYDQDLDPAARWGDGSWPQEEKVAEAFAAWFLMPRPAVLAAAGRIAGGRPRSPEHAYLVARALGTSYAGTVRHLVRLSLLHGNQADQWLKITPAALKSSLVGGTAVPTGAHVHTVTTSTHGQQARVDVGDLLVLQLPGACFGPLPPGLEIRTSPATDGLWGDADTGYPIAVEVTDALDAPCRLTVDVPGSGDPLHLTVARESPRTGVDDIWPP
ncbi:ImmA/IrrE family metallo-endopeptidase [Streptomyces sp. NPDC051554]|uniref:ImmA/IrrE family metallo-endopeptidase n=1 Tax=Streptomyces sp. NPDC051554 TaxID=3365656 RepID=UPI003793CF72